MPAQTAETPARAVGRYQLDTGGCRLNLADRAIAKFAAAYADQNERDYEALVDAAKSGRITAEHGI